MRRTLTGVAERRGTGVTGVGSRGLGRQSTPAGPRASAEAPAPHTRGGRSAAAVAGGFDFSKVAIHPAVPRLAPAPHPHLDPRTPAWTERGQTFLTPRALFLPEAQRLEILRHEAVHRLHHRLGGPLAHADRGRAERLASDVSQERVTDAGAFLRPAPPLLAFPPISTIEPWHKVWIGHTGIVVEVSAQGIPVRTFLSYQRLGLTKTPKFKDYFCQPRHPEEVVALAPRMKAVAEIAAELNRRIPESAADLRVALIVFGPELASGYRKAGGRGALILKETEMDRDTIAHEVGHGRFDAHVQGRVDAASEPAADPDVLAVRFADLFLRLEDTIDVAEPTGKFDPDNPPPLSEVETGGQPAGHVMVTDALWAGSGGHPWESVHELFASAYAAFKEEPALLRQTVRHYSAADTKIPALAEELFILLEAVDDPKKRARLTPPDSPGRAEHHLSRTTRMLDMDITQSSAATVQWAAAPEELASPPPIFCPPPTGTSTTGKGLDDDDLLTPESPREQPEPTSPAPQPEPR